MNIIAKFLSSFQSRLLIKNLGTMGLAQLTIRVSRIVSAVVLSRLLLPNDYGLAAIVLTAYEFISIFTRNGISAKVVQASDAEADELANTAYRMTWILCGSLTIVQLLLAFPIAKFYNDLRLAVPIALMSLIYFATPMSSMQGAFQQREGKLGRIAFASAAQVVVDNILTASFAIAGLGLWAIILPKILVAPIWAIAVRGGHEWRPAVNVWAKPMTRWVEIARFSRNILGVEMLATFQANIDNLLVGLFLGIESLGVYYFAFNAGLGITQGLIAAATVAIYPHFCAVRSNSLQLQIRFWQTVRMLGLTLVPIIFVQAALAPFYVPVIFGQKWLPAVPVLSLICLSALARPFSACCSQLLMAYGRPDIELKWQLVNTAILVAAITFAAQYSIVWVAAAVFLVQTTVLGFYSISIPRWVFGRTNPLRTTLVTDDPSLVIPP